jgi:hypothetical protein
MPGTGGLTMKGRSVDKLKVERLKKFLTELQEVKNEVCKHKECSHFSCPACINGCGGEECAFDAVEDAIYDLQEIEAQEG